jgi:hypothetical protein
MNSTVPLQKIEVKQIAPFVEKILTFTTRTEDKYWQSITQVGGWYPALATSSQK